MKGNLALYLVLSYLLGYVGSFYMRQLGIMRKNRYLLAQQGDSSGASIQCQNVCLSVGNNDIVNNVDWTIMPGERWGLVGQNGAGKSTLFLAITGSVGESNDVKVREGDIYINKKVFIYMAAK